MTERQIGDRYNFKKATIRSALARQAHEELTRERVSPRQCHLANHIARRQQIFEVRSLNEPEIYSVAASSMTERGLEDIKQAARRVQKPETLRSHLAFLAADRIFRMSIAELSGNLRMSRLLGQVLDQLERVLHLGYQSRDFTRLITDQQTELVRACEAGDVAGIVKLARVQCLVLKQVLEAVLASSKLEDVNVRAFT